MEEIKLWHNADNAARNEILVLAKKRAAKKID